MTTTHFTTLNQLSPDEKAELVELEIPKNNIERDYIERLISLGLIPGSILTFIRSAPLGDPVMIGVRGVSLLLRKHEAAVLKLKRLAL